MFEGAVASVMDLTDSELTERFRTLELERRRAAAEMAALTREGERRAIHTVDGHRTIRHWVRAQINCPMPEANRLRRLAIACDTTTDLGDTLMNGHIGVAQADELARLATHPRVGDHYEAIAPQLLRHAEQLSYEEFRVVSRRFETLADPNGAERNDEVSHERRSATVIELGGAIDVRVTGGSGIETAELLGIFKQFVEAEFDADVAARSAEFGPDAPASLLPRTDAQRRFDAFVAIFRAAAIAPADGVAPRPVLNLVAGLNTYERLIERKVTGVDPGIEPDIDLTVERIESTSGVTISPAGLLAASVIAEVRRVVVDAAGVVVDAGRKRRLFTGPAREMALLLSHSCDHLGCTVSAERCEVDHLDEWERDGGRTDQVNGRPRCHTHNPWKTANGIRSKRNQHGDVVDVRADGSPMTPVGRRVHLDPADEPNAEPDASPDLDLERDWERRTLRIEYRCLDDEKVRRWLAA
jgi:hypothetical protein